jgi:hypothetical protein
VILRPGIKLSLASAADNPERCERWGPKMRCVNLTDDELWRAIAQNTEAMSAVLHEELEVPSNPETRANLLRSRWKAINRFQREYRAYTAELQRRHSLG